MDIICLSESWERENETIEDIFDNNEFTVISNPYQRKGRGGRPAIIVNHEKYIVDKLDIPCPLGCGDGVGPGLYKKSNSHEQDTKYNGWQLLL